MKKHFKLIMLNLVPFFVHILFSFFWFFEYYTQIVTLLQGLFVFLLTPCYLFYINRSKIKVLRGIKLILLTIIILSISLSGVLLHYLNWAVTTNNIYTPDPETIALLRGEINLTLLFSLIFFCVSKR